VIGAGIGIGIVLLRKRESRTIEAAPLWTSWHELLVPYRQTPPPIIVRATTRTSAGKRRAEGYAMEAKSRTMAEEG